jgi:type II secretory pathway component HofQ
MPMPVQSTSTSSEINLAAFYKRENYKTDLSALVQSGRYAIITKDGTLGETGFFGFLIAKIASIWP